MPKFVFCTFRAPAFLWEDDIPPVLQRMSVGRQLFSRVWIISAL